MSTSKQKLVFAADLGGTHLRTAVVDDAGTIYHRAKTDTPPCAQPGQIVRALVESARKFSEETTLPGPLSAASVAVPGTVDVATGVVLTAPNLPCLNGFNLRDALEHELRWPVVIENDANAAAVGERWRGAGRGADTVICVTLGTGVGGGIILEGKLWRGADNSAGEIGHMAVDPFGGIQCGCGSYGCLEVYASATAIVRMTQEQSAATAAKEVLTARDIFEAGMEGDQIALEVFRRMGNYLGIGLANLINILNPQVIVIAGGVANGWDLFAEHTMKQVAERAFPLPASRVQIKRGECGDDAGLLGAAQLACS